MEKSEIIKALLAGGALREAAFAVLLSDDEISGNIRDRLKKYRKSLEIHFPSSRRVFGGRQIDNATDYFMLEAVFRFDRKVNEPDEKKKFEGETYQEAKAYIVATAVFMCIGMLRKTNKQSSEEAIPEDVDDYLEKHLLNKEKHRLLHKVLDGLGKGCKKVLLLFYSGYSYEEIAPMLNISTPDVAKVKKHRCYQSLLKLIEDQPVLDELLK